MSFLRREHRTVRGVMDVGSSAIKGMLFEMPSADALPRPRPIRKFVWGLPDALPPLRLVQKVKKSIGEMIKAVRDMPEQIYIGVGPAIGEGALEDWMIRMSEDKGMLTWHDIHAVYRRLFAEHTDPRRATIASPIELLVNGYSLAWQDGWHTEGILPRSQVQEICFRTLGFTMALESGAVFMEVKKDFASVPIEFLPLALAEKEAVVKNLGIRDAFIIDIGGSETALVSVREGRFIHAAFMPFGTDRIAASLPGRLPIEARAIIRQYGMGMGDASLRAEVSASVTRVAEDWKKQFVAVLDVFYPTGSLPATVLVSGGGARLREMRAMIEARDWLGAFSYTDQPSVRVLEGAGFFGGDTLGGNLQGPEDTGLAALILYAFQHQPIF